MVIHSTARAKEVNIVERGIADAIGLNLDIENTKGILIANFGGETTELSVISGRAGLHFYRLVKVGGITFDQAIATLVHYNHDFLIGRLTSETLRKKFGVVIDDSSFLTVAGRDLITGLPQRREISSTLVRVAIQEPLKDCLPGNPIAFGQDTTGNTEGNL